MNLKIEPMTQHFLLMIFIKSKMNFKQIAKRLGVSYATVLKWKEGKSEPHFVNQKVIHSVFKKEIAEYKKEYQNN